MNHLGYPILIIESPGILGYIVNIKRPFSEWQKIQMSNEFGNFTIRNYAVQSYQHCPQQGPILR